MNILVTGAKGFLGRNLIAELKIEDIITYLNLVEKAINRILKSMLRIVTSYFI